MFRFKKCDKRKQWALKSAFADLCSKEIPHAPLEMMEYLEAHALDLEGLFRVPGSATDIATLYKLYASKKKDTLIDLSVYSFHTVGGALKKWFRDMPDPLLTFELYDAWLASIEVPETARARAVHAVFKLLPIAHRSLLQRLIKFLTRVVEHSSKNLMHADNLAIVFAPTILQYEEHIDPLKALEDQSSAQALVSLMISHYDEIFERKPPTVAVDRRASLHRQLTVEELQFFNTLKSGALSMVQTMSLRQKKQSMTAAMMRGGGALPGVGVKDFAGLSLEDSAGESTDDAGDASAQPCAPLDAAATAPTPAARVGISPSSAAGRAKLSAAADGARPSRLTKNTNINVHATIARRRRARPVDESDAAIAAAIVAEDAAPVSVSVSVSVSPSTPSSASASSSPPVTATVPITVTRPVPPPRHRQNGGASLMATSPGGTNSLSTSPGAAAASAALSTSPGGTSYLSTSPSAAAASAASAALSTSPGGTSYLSTSPGAAAASAASAALSTSPRRGQSPTPGARFIFANDISLSEAEADGDDSRFDELIARKASFRRHVGNMTEDATISADQLLIYALEGDMDVVHEYLQTMDFADCVEFDQELEAITKAPIEVDLDFAEDDE